MTTEQTPTLDVSDLARHMGVPIMPGELREPVTVGDIRRWAQAMHYPNPLHYDAAWAAESRFGRIVAPQSFTVATDTSHGCAPAQVGRIPGSHLVFGGDEWWFFEARVEPGDKLLCHRMPYDYKVAETSFAGPTCFQRGDTLYLNQRGQRVALQRCTAIRYQVGEAMKKKLYDDAAEPEWTDAELAKLDEIKAGFIDQIQRLGHDRRLLGDVKAGDVLAPNVLGPHSLASFTTEWRAYPMTTWGAMAKGPTSVSGSELGYTADMAGREGDRDLQRTNPELTDGAYYGPSRGHLQPRWARQVGMPRGYGYGASMGAWVLDYTAAWAGEWGEITHADITYRAPALTGDASFLSGVVTGVREERRRVHVADVAVLVADQNEKVLATGTVSVKLPLS
ncbi:MaoC family dehydratase N-terminal domain-containing protein [Actinocorallia sp. A-T 12471]|uniref:FAS1-like dehydratase domain-containing protein n=1 Tax=Actinocorallia sp. A-T 12471 TaxID=3089813 RepID=UPI0029D2D2A0|nr:MaoC family dehydratase N-terminal domain-containing protein [Actinocorallia sp. A-T 12471]MDX6741462.1 MaoC family dehydratase N-terminal domain-containing protein [Actinocorallia sp. A-T 12471]